MSGIGEAVGEFAALGGEHLCHLVGNRHPAEGLEPVGDGFGEADQVRLHPISLAAKPFAGAAEAADDLIADQQHPALGADAGHFRPVVLRGMITPRRLGPVQR